ncbi:unnamed protein product, partial [Dicrocoelium dendriticum]
WDGQPALCNFIVPSYWFDWPSALSADDLSLALTPPCSTGMSQALGIAIPDIVSTLLDMKMLAYFRTQYYIVNNKAEVNRLIASMRAPDPSRCIDRNCLHWTPHSVAPSMRGGRGSSKLNRSTVSVEETSSNSAN